MVSFGGLGGKDSYTYELLFKYSFSGSSRFINYDILFGYFNKLIRTFTDNVYIYRAICYAIIVYGYVAFIKYVCPENVSALPFITLMIPYLKSFNTMRTSIAISVFLIGLTLLYRKKRFMGGYTDPVNDVYPQDICDICNIFTILLHYREKIEQ